MGQQMQEKVFYEPLVLPVIDWNIRLFGAHKMTVQQNWSYPQDRHHAFEILIVLDGIQETRIENKHYVLNAGDILLIPPGFAHTNKCRSTSMTYFCAHFDIDEPSFRIDIIKNCELVYKSSSVFYEKLRNSCQNWVDIMEIQDLTAIQTKLRVNKVLIELLEVLVEISSLHSEKKCHQSMTTMKYAKDIANEIKQTFKKSIEENEEMCPTLSIQQIIASLGLSPNYGLEIFQKVYHTSPRKYLSDLKLQEAKILLQQPDISLREIGNVLGYKNLAHFSRQFKKWTGLCPSEFRKNPQS